MQGIAWGGASARLHMRRLHHSGRDPLRVLLIGDRAHLLEALPGGGPAERIADRIWLSTRRGVDLDVLTDLGPVLRAVQGVFRAWRLWRYDVVLIALGGLDSVARPRTLAHVGELVQEVLADAADETDIVVLATTPDGGRDRAATDRLRATLRDVGSPNIRLHEVGVAGDPSASARAIAFAAGAEILVSQGRAVVASAAATLRDRPDDESARQRALDELHIVGSAPDARLDDLVELGRTAFGTSSAEINFIDHDRQWKMAVAGSERGEDPRAHSFCSQTVRRASPTIVADALVDPEFSAFARAPGRRPIRFYAAHPIESTDGYRIGSFCVYDPEPRDVSGLHLQVLRDLALLAQAAIVGDGAPTGAEVGGWAP